MRGPDLEHHLRRDLLLKILELVFSWRPIYYVGMARVRLAVGIESQTLLHKHACWTCAARLGHLSDDWVVDVLGADVPQLSRCRVLRTVSRPFKSAGRGMRTGCDGRCLDPRLYGRLATARGLRSSELTAVHEKARDRLRRLDGRRNF